MSPFHIAASLGFLTTLQAAGVVNKLQEDTWCYTPSVHCNQGPDQKACGPNEWNKVAGFEACAQQGTQSPIDMKLSEATKMESKGFEMQRKSIEGDEDCAPVNNLLTEHTVRVEIPGACKAYYVMWKGKQYKLVQFHFHSPSENTWDGKYYAMEAHYVHKAEDGTFVVLATMIGVKSDEATMANKFLKYVLDNTPKPNDAKDNLHSSKTVNFFPNAIDLGILDPYDFLPASIKDSQWHYDGSMTTPPCTAEVEWVMSPEAVYVTQGVLDKYRGLINSNPNDQLAPFGTIMGLGGTAKPHFHSGAGSIAWTAGLGSNNRPVQPLTGSENKNRKLYVIGNPPNNGGSSFILYLAIAAIFVFIAVGGFLVYTQRKTTNGRESGDAHSLLLA